MDDRFYDEPDIGANTVYDSVTDDVFEEERRNEKYEEEMEEQDKEIQETDEKSMEETTDTDKKSSDISKETSEDLEFGQDSEAEERKITFKAIMKRAYEIIKMGVKAVFSLAGSAIRSFIFGDRFGSEPLNLVEQANKAKNAEDLKKKADKVKEEQKEQSEQSRQKEGQSKKIEFETYKKDEMIEKLINSLHSDKEIKVSGNVERCDIGKQLGMNLTVERNRFGEPMLCLTNQDEKTGKINSKQIPFTIENIKKLENKMMPAMLKLNSFKLCEEKYKQIYMDSKNEENYCFSSTMPHDIENYTDSALKVSLLKATYIQMMEEDKKSANTEDNLIHKDLVNIPYGNKSIQVAIDGNRNTNGSIQSDFVVMLDSKEVGRIPFEQIQSAIKGENEFNSEEILMKIRKNIYNELSPVEIQNLSEKLELIQKENEKKQQDNDKHHQKDNNIKEPTEEDFIDIGSEDKRESETEEKPEMKKVEYDRNADDLEEAEEHKDEIPDLGDIADDIEREMSHEKESDLENEERDVIEEEEEEMDLG